jgi:hypothetical protein
MYKKTLFLLNIPLVLLLLLILTSLVLTYHPQRAFSSYPKDAEEEIRKAEITVNGRTFTADLPCTIHTDKARTPVRVTFRLDDSPKEFLYVKTVYCPLTVSADREVLASIGMLVNYPSFMRDPATEIRFISLPASSGGRTVTLTYYSPYGRDYVTISRPLVGKIGSIVSTLSRQFLPAFLLSMLMLFVGILIILITVASSLRRQEIRTIFHLGIFSLMAGVWGLSENNMTLWFIDAPGILYILSFMALECLIIPFIRFFRIFAQLKYRKFLAAMSAAAEIAPLVSLLLQVTGKIPLYTSIRYFHIMLPAMFTALTIITIMEFRMARDVENLKLLSQIGILLIAALIEVLNYYFRFLPQNSFLFEIGIMIFILYTGFLYVRYTYHLIISRRQMETEIRMLTIESREQEKRTVLMMENSRATRRLRHDIRQHLIVIRSMAEENADNRLIDYINTLIASIPSAVQTFCENPSVNAIVSYYAGVCEQDGIDFNAVLDLPAELPGISVMELCSVFGNLLENGLEACRRMSIDGERYIHFRSRIQLNTLTITMDNSFDGKAVRSGDLYRSSKDHTHGIGLSSIRAAARMHSGDALFESEDKVFHSSVYMALGGEEQTHE